jgi:hypothetical protein
MEVEIYDGITLVNKYEEFYNIQFIPKDSDLHEVIENFTLFLKSCGYSEKLISDYFSIE